MRDRTWQVRVGAHEVTAAFDAAATNERCPAFVFAHGAGGHMADRGVLALAARLRARGLHVVRFNFPYSQRHSRRPDPMPLLQACIAAVASRAADEIDAERWLLGGRSMGGRAASMLVADGYGCDALLLLAYPLHPAGKPEALRDAHLARIATPVLCFNGTRDPLCRQDLMDGVVERLSSNWRMHWLQEADHSFHVTRASGRTDADVLDEVGDATANWIGSVTPRKAADRHSLR